MLVYIVIISALATAIAARASTVRRIDIVLMKFEQRNDSDQKIKDLRGREQLVVGRGDSRRSEFTNVGPNRWVLVLV